MVSRRGKRRSSKSKSHELRTPAFEALNAEELNLRSRLIEQAGNSIFISGIALAQLNEDRLYRNTHLNFDEFCQDVFSYTSDYAYLKMAAARVYQNLIDNLPPSEGKPTIGRDLPLPTRQRQLRPIVKAKLDSNAQVEVWSNAIALNGGKVPTNSIVSEAVRLYLAENDSIDNPFTEGEVCRLVVRGNPQLKGFGGCWCIVERVHLSTCTVNTWSDELEVSIDNLESLEFDELQYRGIEDIGVRMTQLYQTGQLDEAALWVLKGLAKLDRPYLTPLEEKLLQVLESEYGINS